MKDEIKEILDNLKYCKEHDEENNYYPEDIFSKDEPYKLLDYITNLQEQLEEYQKALDETMSEKMDLQEENKRYKRIFEGKERFSKIMPDDIDFIIISKADYDRQQEDIELELIDYKLRNEKAIELTNNLLKTEDKGYYQILFKKQLEVLQGDDNE